METPSPPNEHERKTAPTPETTEPIRDSVVQPSTNDASLDTPTSVSSSQPFQGQTYRTYKRRFFPLIQLALLNIITSWDWLTYAPVASTSATFFNVSVPTVNWIATAELFAFVVSTPLAIYALNRGGPKPSILIASVLLFVGNWIRYGGARVGNDGNKAYGLTMLGQMLIGLSQPFVLSAPTRLSEMWFQERGRIAATALTSLANPLGGALGQLIDPLWATQPSDIPNMVLYVSIISTVATVPSFFIPAQPPTPPTPTASQTPPRFTLRTFANLFRNPSFLLLFIPFFLYVSLFNAISSVLTSILTPYSFTETESGLTGGILILAGLVAAALSSPLLDRAPRLRLPAIKLLVPVLAAMYLAFVWAPGTRGVAAPYVISGILGATSFVLVPLVLEMIVDVTWGEAGPEAGSAVCWAAGQLGGGIGIIILDALGGVWGSGEPPGNYKAGLVFMAVAAWVVVPIPMLLGWRGWGTKRRGVASGDGGGEEEEYEEHDVRNAYADADDGRVV